MYPGYTGQQQVMIISGSQQQQQLPAAPVGM